MKNLVGICVLFLFTSFTVSCVSQQPIQPAERKVLEIQALDSKIAKNKFRTNLIEYLRDPAWIKLNHSKKANRIYNGFMKSTYIGAQATNEGKSVMFLYNSKQLMYDDWFFIAFDSNPSSTMSFHYVSYRDVYALKISHARVVYAVGLEQKPKVVDGYWSFQVKDTVLNAFDSSPRNASVNPQGSYLAGLQTKSNDAVFTFNDEFEAKKFASVLLGAFPNIRVN